MTEITPDTYKYKYEEQATAVYDTNTVRFWRLISWYLYFAPIWFFLKIWKLAA